MFSNRLVPCHLTSLMSSACQVTVISRDTAVQKGPTVTVRTMKEQASAQHGGNQMQFAKAAASAALAATAGTTIERLQAAAQAAYEASSTAAPDEHASTVQQALYEVVQQMQVPDPVARLAKPWRRTPISSQGACAKLFKVVA